MTNGSAASMHATACSDAAPSTQAAVSTTAAMPAGDALRLARLLFTALVGAASYQPFATAAAATHTVAIDGTNYTPATLTVKHGDRIVWKNSDPFPHTVTATNKAFDSKAIAAGASWSWVAAKPGRYDYVCTFHPTMKATLIVQ